MMEARFWGGAAEMSVVVDSEGQVLHPWHARVWTLYDVDGKSGAVELPDATLLRTGGPQLVIINDTIEDIDLVDFDLTLVATLTAGWITTVCLVDNSTEAGTWVTKQVAKNSPTKWLNTRTGSIVGGSTAGLFSFTLAWATGTSPPNAHAEGAAMPLETAKYVVGDDPASAKNDELRGSTWTNRTDYPSSIRRQVGGGASGMGWIFAGDGVDASKSYRFDAWTSRSSFGWPLTRGVARTIGDRTYIVPGEPVPSPPKAHKATVDVYHGITAFASPSRYGPAAFELHGRLVVAGGKSDVGPTWYDNVDEYTRSTDTWAAKTAIAGGARHRAGAWGANAKGYVAGGRNNADAVIGTAYEYKANAWTGIASMGTAVADAHNQSFPI